MNFAWRSARARCLAAVTTTLFGLFIAISGQAGWLASYGGPGQDHGTALVTLQDGTSFLVGAVWNSTTGLDVVVRKYDAVGGLLWTRGYDGATHGDDVPRAAVGDGSGGIVVTGSSQIAGAASDCLLLRLDASGNLSWSRTYHSWDGGRNFGAAVAKTALGDFVAAGASYDTTSQEDALLVCYSPDGALCWARSDDGGFNGSDELNGLAALSNGDVVCTGIVGAADSTGDYWTRRISGSTGAVQWQDRYDGPMGDEDRAFAVAVGAGDQSFVTGFSRDLDTIADCVTICISSVGARLWTQRLAMPEWGFSQGTRIRVGPDGSVYAGGFVDLGGDVDALVVKYTAGGAISWARSLAGFSGAGEDEVLGLDTDALGRLYVAAASESSGVGYEATTFVLDGAGNLRWRWSFAGNGGGTDIPTAIRVPAPGRVIMAGSETNTASGLDLFILSADSTSNVVSVEDQPPPGKPTIRIEMENPVRQVLHVSLSVTRSAALQVGVFDVMGRQVAGGRSPKRFPSGEHRIDVNVEPLAAGVYVLRVQGHVDGHPQGISRKFVVLR
jgi:hypothetical protein